MKPSEIWAVECPAEEKLVALAIVDYGRIAYPRQAVLARKCGMSRRTLQRILSRMEEETGTSPIRIRIERRKRGLVYRVEMRQSDAPECVNLTPMMRQSDAPRCVNLTHPSKLVQGTSPPNPESADAETGGGVAQVLCQAIRTKYPRETPEAHGRVCRRILSRYGIDGQEADECFETLLRKWLDRGGAHGNDAYATLARYTEDLAGARVPRAVLVAKIKDPNR